MDQFWSYVNGHGEGFFWFCLLIGLPALGLIVNGLVSLARTALRVPVHNHYHTHNGSGTDTDTDDSSSGSGTD